MNMFTAINSAMDIALTNDETVTVFGEDVAFGGVFRCSMGLAEKHGSHRVFNTPLCEQGIAAFGIGLAANGTKPIMEMQFADYIFPAFDQLVNEAAKYRYRSGGQFDVGGLVVRTPYGAVGHGGLYHSQSPEAYFAHTPGLQVLIASNPVDAKGLLLAAVENDNPTLVMEPKWLYRSAVAEVPTGHYTTPIGKAVVEQEGTDITVIGYGAQMVVLSAAAAMAKEKHGISVELINLRSILPWDVETVTASVRKTGRAVVSHEAPRTCGFAAEVSSSIAEHCFLSLEAPVARVTGYDTPFPLAHEKFYLPSELKCLDAIVDTVNY